MANPKVTERRNAYYAALAADRKMLAVLPRERLAAAIASRKLWTIPEAFERRTDGEMVEDIARCMRSRDRALWLAALEIPDVA